MAKIKKFIIFIFNFLLSFVFASFLFLLVFTINEFICSDLGFSKDSSAYLIITYLFSFLIFILTIIFWLKYKSLLKFLFVIFTIILLYNFGFIYARKFIIPFEKAEEYKKEADLILKKWESVNPIKDNDIDNFLNDYKKAVDLLYKTTLLNYGYEPWIKKYYVTIYEVEKDIYEYYKNTFKEGKKISEEESKELFKSFNNKLEANHYIKPFWMDFYFLNPLKTD